MKFKMMTAVLLMLMMSSIGLADVFDTEKLPIGDKDKRYHYVKAKLNEILNTDSNKVVTSDFMYDDLATKRIVMVGESHTNQDHHDMQLDVIRGLHERGKTVILALEMFNPSQDSLLQRWVDGKMTEDEWLHADGYMVTWSYNYRYYKAIFDYCRDNNITIKGVNVPSKYASRVNRVSIAGLTDEERAAIPDVHLDSEEHRFFFSTAVQGMDATMPAYFPSMYEAQSLWDTAMGEGSIKHALANPDAVIVTLAGSGHVVYNIGIGRIIQDRSDLSFASVVAVDVEDTKASSGMGAHGPQAKAEDKGAKKKPGFFARLFGRKQAKEVVDEEPKVEAKRDHSMGHMGGMGDGTPFKVVTRSLADYIWGKPMMTKELYPSFGFSSKMQGTDSLLVSRVMPGTIAWDNGLKKGDIILSIDGKRFSDRIDYQLYLATKNWDEEINFALIRDDKQKDISFIIQEEEEEDCPCDKD